MVSAQKIKKAIKELPEKEYISLRKWFSETDWKKWDKKIKQDSEKGKLDFLIEEALEEKRKGNLKEI